MNARRWICLSLAVAVALPVPHSAHAASDPAESRYIVRLRAGLEGLPLIKLVCQIAGCRVVRGLDDPSGALSGSLFLVDSLLPLDLSDLTTPLLKLLGVVSAERDLRVPLLQDAGSPSTGAAEVDPLGSALQDFLWRRDPASYYGSQVPEGYLQQPAVGIVRLREAQCDYGASGAGLVAVIDTGVDVAHPALAGALEPGYDFTRNVAGADEMKDVRVEQESAALLDGPKDPYRCTQESAALLDQESAALLDCDGEGRSGFGHGTMVAGVIRLVAPKARILPLKAFSVDGNAYTSDIIRAIRYAVQKKANVLNMSFSRPTHSPELKLALDAAARSGVVAVASAGNEGEQALRWPAALDNVIGVASTTNADARSSFSNYGSHLVSLAAPGEGIITTYPKGSYAAVWGTSFSTPLVSGTAALFVGMKTALSPAEAAWALSQAKWVSSELGAGRLDVYKAVRAGRLAWPSLGGLPGAPSAGCEAR